MSQIIESNVRLSLTIFPLPRRPFSHVLTLTERGQREATRAEIVDLLGGSAKAADHVIESLRRKGWLQRATLGRVSSYTAYAAGTGAGSPGR